MFTYYYLRDIRKCGITFPRRLILEVGKKLYEKYGSPFDLYRIFEDDNIEYYLEDGSEFKTKRGYFLGMANNMVTLIQAAIFRMVKDRFDAEAEDSTLKFLCGNDDSFYRIDNSDNVDLMDICILEDIDQNVC